MFHGNILGKISIFMHGNIIFMHKNFVIFMLVNLIFSCMKISFTSMKLSFIINTLYGRNAAEYLLFAV